MATNPAGKGKKVVSASVSIEIYQLIEKRAKKLGTSNSRIVADILEEWVERGCPLETNLDISVFEEDGIFRAADPQRHLQPLTRTYQAEEDKKALCDWKKAFPDLGTYALTHLQNWLAVRHPRAALNQVLPPLLAEGYEFAPDEAFEPQGPLKKPKQKPRSE